VISAIDIGPGRTTGNPDVILGHLNRGIGLGSSAIQARLTLCEMNSHLAYAAGSL